MKIVQSSEHLSENGGNLWLIQWTWLHLWDGREGGREEGGKREGRGGREGEGGEGREGKGGRGREGGEGRERRGRESHYNMHRGCKRLLTHKIKCRPSTEILHDNPQLCTLKETRGERKKGRRGRGERAREREEKGQMT